MKAWFIIATTAFSCILPVTAIAPSKALNQSPVRQEPNHNVRTNWYSEIDSLSRLEYLPETKTSLEPLSERGTNLCQLFSNSAILEEDPVEAPPPVRTLYDGNPQQATSLDSSELVFYQRLGLIQSRDGSHVCLVEDPDNARRQFTIFKVKKVNNILVISTFLNSGKFMKGQESAATKMFVEMIRFYTDIPDSYHQGIRNYLEEFYVRMRDGRIVPSSDRAYPVDEPTASVIMYHPLQGPIPGTGISLNIPLP